MSQQLQNISLFIPHVFLNFDKDYIAYALEDIGEIERIDFVLKVDGAGKQYNAVYVHFNRWFSNSYATRLHDDIVLNGSAKVYHDDKWYWIVLQNTGKKHASAGERKPRIELGEKNVVNKCYNEIDYDYASEVEIEDTNGDDEKLDEIERVMEEEDANIVCIDSRYVQAIEEENEYLRSEVFQLREALIKMDQMYQAEAAKVRTLTTEI
jgi:hypothetical protein